MAKKTYVRNRRTRMACVRHPVRPTSIMLAERMQKLSRSLSEFIKNFSGFEIKPWQQPILESPMAYLTMPRPTVSREMSLERIKARPPGTGAIYIKHFTENKHG